MPVSLAYFLVLLICSTTPLAIKWSTVVMTLGLLPHRWDALARLAPTAAALRSE